MGVELLEHGAQNCSYPSVKNAAKSLKEMVENKNRLKKVYGSEVKIEMQIVDIERAKKANLEKLIDDSIQTKNKTEIKHLDVLLYGPELEGKKKD